jgi:hypothetical protein
MESTTEVSSDICKKLEHLVLLFRNNKDFELEAKLKQKITASDFSNVIKYLRSTKKNTEKLHEYVLDIFTRYKDENICRISIQGTNTIEQYCRTNIIPSDVTPFVMMKKNIPKVFPIYFEDFNYKIDLKHEYKIDDIKKKEILAALPSLMKGFRLKKRFTYTDISEMYQFDLTIVKSSQGQNFIASKTFAESNVTFSPEEYEIEIEMIKCNKKNTDQYCVKAFLSALIEIVSVISNDEYIIKQSEKINVLQTYINLAFGKKDKFNKQKAFNDAKNKPKQYFSGPQPVTLEQKNIVAPELGFNSIQSNYTVTEKADGERILLYVHNNGKCYFINNRLDVKFTGVTLNTITNTLIDGEYITKNIINKPTKIFAVFDIYWENSIDVRIFPLVSENSKAPSRLQTMNTLISKIKDNFSSKNIDIFVKEFKYGQNIFTYCDEIMTNKILGKFNYKIDGLIFTPQKYPVGGSHTGDVPESTGTWNKVYKWKPPEDNTIDFLVNMQNNDFTLHNQQLYKVLNLFVGYNPVQWEVITPRDYLENKLSRTYSYIEKPFIPGDILDSSFSQYHCKFKENSKILCENGDEITNKSIVEFAYNNKDDNIPYSLRWIPLRVRQDKTDMYNRYGGISGAANDYGTAINIWKSIKFEVSEKMIIGKHELYSKDIIDDDVYYYRLTSRDKFASKPMLDFHNYWIKSNTLFKKFKGKTTLFDVSCGKGGDIPKWIENGFTKVLGVDISRDNIENPIDGAYARLLTNKKHDFKNQYVFTTMDSSQKITQEYIKSLSNPNDILINNLLWGYDKYAAIDKYYNFADIGIGFDVVSCQFSIHYFFETENKLDNLIWNINNHLKIGGHFIGTCIDGQKLKTKLAHLKYGESINGEKYNKVLWNIRKMYNNNNTIKFGDSIDVYMESIGRIFKEYIVDFNVLVEKFAAYGIELLNPQELKKIGLDNSFETFDKAFDKVKDAHVDTYNQYYLDSIKSMSDDEKKYSFMNMWFVFIKRGKTSTAKEEDQPKKKKITKKKI